VTHIWQAAQAQTVRSLPTRPAERATGNAGATATTAYELRSAADAVRQRSAPDVTAGASTPEYVIDEVEAWIAVFAR
jgi:4-hydroxy-3-methylbut-2-enyl diphosphate reductase IspH